MKATLIGVLYGWVQQKLQHAAARAVGEATQHLPLSPWCVAAAQAGVLQDQRRGCVPAGRAGIPSVGAVGCAVEC